MNDLEERIRQDLTDEVQRFLHRDRASLGVPRLVPGIRRRVRRRQLGMAVLSLAVAAGLVAGSVAAVDLMRGKGADTSVPADTPERAETPRGWPQVTYGGDFHPPGGPNDGRDEQRVVVVYGTVTDEKDEYRWSLVLYRDAPKIMRNGRTVRGGLCEAFFIVEPGDGGGSGASCPSGSDDRRPDLLLSADSLGGTRFVSYQGTISRRVDRVDVRLEDGRSFTVRIFDGPGRTHANHFVFFPPAHTEGRVVVLDSDGSVLDRQQFCSTIPARAVTRGDTSTGSSFAGSGTTTESKGDTTGIAGGSFTTTGHRGFCH